MTWALTAVTAVLVNFYVPWLPVVVWGMVVAIFLHPLIAWLPASRVRLRRRHGTGDRGMETGRPF